jgi:hypothetical protein
LKLAAQSLDVSLLQRAVYVGKREIRRGDAVMCPKEQLRRRTRAIIEEVRDEPIHSLVVRRRELTLRP